MYIISEIDPIRNALYGNNNIITYFTTSDVASIAGRAICSIFPSHLSTTTVEDTRLR